MENKLARFFRNTGRIRFFLPIAVILIVMGIFSFITTPAKYDQTVGTVTGITEVKEDDDISYDVSFDYTVDGKTYSNTFPSLPDEYAVGESIDVFYDPADPTTVANTKHGKAISVGMIAVGVLMLAYSVASTIKAYRKDRELDERLKEAAGTETVPEVVAPPREELTEYYVRFDGHTFRPGYILEDGSRKELYTAEMKSNNLFKGRTFVFTDNRSGLSETHTVSHPVTESFDNEFFSTNSYFKIDGKNVWDILHERGIRISTDIHSKFPKAIYTVSLNGRFFAIIETSSQYVHEEDEEKHTIKLPVGNWYYRCWTNESDLELLFLNVFAISETDQPIVG